MSATKYTFQQLRDLWIQVGGDPKYADMAAAIATAESGGHPDEVSGNTNGSVDRGLWQINSIHGSQSTIDPVANARAAVSISNNGSNWRPWCTAWSNGRCGGTFMGAGSPVLKYLPSGVDTTSTGSVVTDASFSTSSSSNPLSGLFSGATGGLWGFLGIQPIALWGIVVAASGVLVMLVGIVLLLLSTRVVKGAVGLAGGSAVSSAVSTKVSEKVKAKPATDVESIAPTATAPAYATNNPGRTPRPPASARDQLFETRGTEGAQRRRLAAQEDDIREGLRPQPRPRALRRRATTEYKGRHQRDED